MLVSVYLSVYERVYVSACHYERQTKEIKILPLHLAHMAPNFNNTVLSCVEKKPIYIKGKKQKWLHDNPRLPSRRRRALTPLHYATGTKVMKFRPGGHIRAVITPG